MNKLKQDSKEMFIEPITQNPLADASTDIAPPDDMVDEILFEAKRKITLRCGKASITLHRTGKITLHGEYILSDADGVNRLSGAQIIIN